jgi:hypothetical protein
MDLLWFLLFVIIGRWAWVARRDARNAGELAKRLQRDLKILEQTLERVQARGGAEPAAPA